MKHNVKWSTRTNVDKMKISNELSMFVYDTFVPNGGGGLQFALSTSVMLIHFDVIPAINQMVLSMTG